MKKLSDTYKELGIAFSLPIEIKDSKGNDTYYEDNTGYWSKREYDSKGNPTHFENRDGFWWKREYDADGKETHFEDNRGYKIGTPRPVKAFEGKVVEVDGIKYELKAL